MLSSSTNFCLCSRDLACWQDLTSHQSHCCLQKEAGVIFPLHAIKNKQTLSCSDHCESNQLIFRNTYVNHTRHEFNLAKPKFNKSGGAGAQGCTGQGLGLVDTTFQVGNQVMLLTKELLDASSRCCQGGQAAAAVGGPFTMAALPALACILWPCSASATWLQVQSHCQRRPAQTLPLSRGPAHSTPWPSLSPAGSQVVVQLLNHKTLRDRTYYCQGHDLPWQDLLLSRPTLRRWFVGAGGTSRPFPNVPTAARRVLGGSNVIQI